MRFVTSFSWWNNEITIHSCNAVYNARDKVFSQILQGSKEMSSLQSEESFNLSTKK